MKSKNHIFPSNRQFHLLASVTFCLLFSGLVFGAETPVAQDASAPLAQRVKDVFTPAAPESVRISGRLGDKLNLCITNRRLAQDIEAVVAPYQAKTETGSADCCCEYWGIHQKTTSITRRK
jgi:hypothetical protein